VPWRFGRILSVSAGRIVGVGLAGGAGPRIPEGELL